MLRIITSKLNIPSTASFQQVALIRAAAALTINFGTTAMNSDTGVTNKDHLTVTSNQSRDSAVHEVTVTKMFDMSPTVKHLTLYSDKRPRTLTFKAGQWVDMYIKGVEQVGGFSITSSPRHLQSTGEIYLAVKNSDSPPSKWVHTQCKEGCTVSIRVGGDFFLNLSSDNFKKESSKPQSILFIAGGVGINPLASMIAEIKDMDFKTNEGKPLQVTLLFSAKTVQELIFREEFDAIQSSCFSPHYFVTNGLKDLQINEQQVKYGRITLQDIQRVLKDATKAELFVYMCGPSGMTSDLQNTLASLGVKHVFFEKWW